MKALIVALLFAPALLAAPACCTKELAPATPLTDKSIYQVESIWTSDYGKQVKLQQLRGKPQLLTMFFASCEFACPVLMYDLGKIEAALKEAGVTNVGFVLVTIDPARDTPERLHAFRTQRKLDDKWLLLHGQNEDVLELGALLGVKFKKETRGQFAHSNIISVLNADGELVHQQTGLNQDPAATIAAIKKLIGESAPPAL